MNTMRTTSDNPATNQLLGGVTLEQLEQAVKISGYLLQRVVAEQLLDDFHVTEEWGYNDRETKEHRALDVFAFYMIEESQALRVSVALLIECKRAELPYVFFRTAAPRVPFDFPTIVSLRGKDLELHKAGIGSRSVSGTQFLKLHNFEFVASGPPICSAFARAERKGKELDLSGTVPFNQVMLPLLSALQHFVEGQKEIGSTERVPSCMTLCICVLDASMVCVGGSPESPQLELCPWVRVIRQEAAMGRQWVTTRHYVVDFVHRSFLNSFIREHLLRFAKAFAERAVGREQLLCAGKGCVPNWDSWTFNDLQPVK